MTGATTGGFTISASSTFSPGSFEAWRACDGNFTTDWAMQGSTFPIMVASCIPITTSLMEGRNE